MHSICVEPFEANLSLGAEHSHSQCSVMTPPQHVPPAAGRDPELPWWSRDH